MDMQACKQCGSAFDFDKGGLGSSFGGYVCSTECARKAAKQADRKVAIHDDTGKIVETNATSEELQQWPE